MTHTDEVPDRFDPGEAWAHADAVDSRARRHARWPAWLWLVLGVAMPTHLIFSQVGAGTWLDTVAAWLLPAVVVGGLVYCVRQRAESRLAERLIWPVTGVFVALVMLDLVLYWTVLGDGPVASVVVFALLPAVPLFYGAWRVLRG